ncbi:hypothetical protein HPB47_024072 [Ixodes persulcatus]|uniref:Uncharacterized protein n=1 Tax=Ixodes persulcatus TaxID=34615 RepID=A0AC60Q5B2_IXOPE|nr:hypothetical protein HPB47_024072 [Ixodes persulcatus]
MRGRAPAKWPARTRSLLTPPSLLAGHNALWQRRPWASTAAPYAFETGTIVLHSTPVIHQYQIYGEFANFWPLTRHHGGEAGLKVPHHVIFDLTPLRCYIHKPRSPFCTSSAVDHTKHRTQTAPHEKWQTKHSAKPWQKDESARFNSKKPPEKNQHWPPLKSANRFQLLSTPDLAHPVPGPFKARPTPPHGGTQQHVHRPLIDPGHSLSPKPSRPDPSVTTTAAIQGTQPPKLLAPTANSSTIGAWKTPLEIMRPLPQDNPNPVTSPPKPYAPTSLDVLRQQPTDLPSPFAYIATMGQLLTQVVQAQQLAVENASVRARIAEPLADNQPRKRRLPTTLPPPPAENKIEKDSHNDASYQK